VPVSVYPAGQRRELIEHLRGRPGTLLLVKSGLLNELLRELPPSVEFVACRERGAVTAGWVRARGGPGDRVVARR
jgi:hypothetical protein